MGAARKKGGLVARGKGSGWAGQGEETWGTGVMDA